MKTFKLKDLLVAVVPEEGARLDEETCPVPSNCPDLSICSTRTCPLNTCADFTCYPNTCIGRTCYGDTGCPNFTCQDFSRCLGRTCRFTLLTQEPPVLEQARGRTAAGRPPGPREELAELRRELKAALADVERLERKAPAPRDEPGSIEEVEELEQRLRGALDELAERKKSMKGE